MVGVTEVEVVYQSQKAVLPLLVVDTPGPPLLGREWLPRIKLDWAALLKQDPISNADGLSRLPLPEPAGPDNAQYIDNATENDPIPADIIQMLEDATKSVDVDHVRAATDRNPVLSRGLGSPLAANTMA